MALTERRRGELLEEFAKVERILEATPAVDTNVARVIRRAFHPRRDKDPNDKVVWATAEKLVPLGGKNAWAFNQGIMELGALVCTARIARCGECPVRTACKTGRRSG